MIIGMVCRGGDSRLFAVVVIIVVVCRCGDYCCDCCCGDCCLGVSLW